MVAVESRISPWNGVGVSSTSNRLPSVSSARSVACVVVGAFALVVFTACSSDDEPARNGVDNVLQACQLRVAWKNPTAEKCVNCVAAAPSPQCDCEAFKEFAGLCKTQDDARRAEPSCTGAMEDCARACKDDCACVDACYAQAAACKRIIDGRDGCVVDVCTPYCN
jgi:hypothetical protein